ncbi:hypothetical protein TW65_01858 [Stemphylium lycopersici]|nr:hypothetical protein TW65_01858 [Stemphylium lycopersici]
MSLFAELFSCGRARKTREPSSGPLETNDATPEPVAHDTTAPVSIDKSAIDPTGDIRAQHEENPGCVSDPTQNHVPSDTEKRSRSPTADEDIELAIVHEKAKPSAGWMVEQRVLVTTRPSTAKDTTPTPQAEPEFESETNEATPSVRCATPEQEPWNSTPVARSATPEPQPSDMSSTVCSPIPEPKSSETVAARSATPEPEVKVQQPESKLEVQQPEAKLQVQQAEPELEIQPSFLPAPEEISLPESAEIEPSMPESEVEAHEALPVEKAAPASFLNLPPEVRNQIYDKMNEDVPIRMVRHDDPALVLREGESARTQRRQFYNLTQVCHDIRDEFLPVYENKMHYIIDLWSQKTNLAKVEALKGQVSMDIDAACFDMEPIDLLPLLRCLIRTGRTDCRFTSTEGVVFRSISEIVAELNKLLPAADGSNKNWLEAVMGPMKKIDLHLFPHDDIRQYYRFRGAEPLVRVVYPSAKSAEWMKRASKSDGYEEYLEKTGLNKFEMHVVVGHASRRTTNQGRLPLDWRMSYQLSRQSMDRTPRISMEVAAAPAVVGGLINSHPVNTSERTQTISLPFCELDFTPVMSDIEHKDEQPAVSKCEPHWDTTDPLQQEVSRIMKSLPRDLCGVLALGSDGVLRSVTADRKVLGAEGLTPELAQAFSMRLPEDYRAKITHPVTADGTKLPKEKWFDPDPGILPKPLAREKVEEIRNQSEEYKNVLRQHMKEDDKSFTTHRTRPEIQPSCIKARLMLIISRFLGSPVSCSHSASSSSPALNSMLPLVERKAKRGSTCSSIV